MHIFTTDYERNVYITLTTKPSYKIVRKLMFRIVLSVRHASSQNIQAGPMYQVYMTNLVLLSVSAYRFIYSAFASFRQGARKEKRGRWNFLIPFGRVASSFPDGTLA